LFYNKLILNDVIHETYYKDDQIITINNDNKNDFEINLQEINKYRLKKYYNNDEIIYNISDDEITINNNNYLYKFIINCGNNISNTKQINNE
jgi:hypothetical protein